MLHNAVDLSRVIQQLHAQGYPVELEDVAKLSSYITSKLMRYGDFVADLNQILPLLKRIC